VRARDCPIGETVRMADLEIGPLDRRRRGVAVGWGIYGNEVRSQLGFGQDQTPSSPSASVATAPANDDLVAAVKDLQASENSQRRRWPTAWRRLVPRLMRLNARLLQRRKEPWAKAPRRPPTGHPRRRSRSLRSPNRRPRLDRRPRATSRRWRQIGRAGATPHGLKAAVSASA
jgi:hypothetical protein